MTGTQRANTTRRKKNKQEHILDRSDSLTKIETQTLRCHFIDWDIGHLVDKAYEDLMTPWPVKRMDLVNIYWNQAVTLKWAYDGVYSRSCIVFVSGTGFGLSSDTGHCPIDWDIWHQNWMKTYNNRPREEGEGVILGLGIDA